MPVQTAGSATTTLTIAPTTLAPTTTPPSTTTPPLAATSTTAVPSTNGSATVTHLSSFDGTILVALTVGFVLLAGLVVAIGRRVLAGGATTKSLITTLFQREPKSGASATAQRPQNLGSPPKDKTLVRSWIAIVLVGALVLFCAAAFWIDDETVRSTLLGGLVATSGTAVAFYFSSKASDQARQDVLGATLGKVAVPSLLGKDLEAVHKALGTVPFFLDTTPASVPADWAVTSQDPPANNLAAVGSTIKATFESPT